MPTVPKYEKRVEERGIGDISLRSTAPVVGRVFNGDAVAGALTQVAGLVQDFQNEADKVKIKQARNDLNKWETDNVYDYRSGAVAKTGESSFGIVPELKSSLDKFSQDYRGGLSNDRQRQAFDDMVAERWGHVEGWAQGHMAKQAEVVKNTTFRATLDSSKARAASDPSTIETELSVINEAILDQYGKTMTPEFISNEMRNQESDLHKGVVNAILLKGDEQGAESYYTAKKDRIAAEDRGAIEAKIKQHGEQLQKERKEKLEMAALNVIEETKDFDSLPKNVIAALDASTRSAYRSYADRLSKGEQVETDWGVYYGLKNMAADGGKAREAFVGTNLNQHRDRLADSEYKELVNLQMKHRSGEDVDKTLGGYRTRTQIVEGALNESGISKKDSNKDTIGRFQRMVDERVLERQKQTGKPVADEEFQQIVDNLLIKVVVKDGGVGFFDKKIQAFQLKPGDEVVPISRKRDIPEAEIPKIEKVLNAHGIPVTDDVVIEFYNRLLAKKLTR
jgi:hypothetical protein